MYPFIEENETLTFREGDTMWRCHSCAQFNLSKRKTCTRCRSYRVVEERVPDASPCEYCGQACGSQYEFIEHNRAKPWRYCSGCDPCLVPCPECGEDGMVLRQRDKKPILRCTQMLCTGSLPWDPAITRGKKQGKRR